MKRAINTDMGGTVARERVNSSYEKYNFDDWVFEHLSPRPGMSVLDIGFGGGKQIKLIRDKVLPGGKISGIDLSVECVKHMRKFLAQQDDDHVQLFNGHMDDTPSIFSGSRYDLIYSVYSFYYSSNMVELLGQLDNLLAEGGRICVFGPGSQSNEQMISLINEVSRKNVSAYENFMSADQIQRVSQMFSSVKIERLKNKICFPNKDEVMSWLASSELYDSDLSEAIGSAVDNVIKLHGDFKMTKETLCVILEK